MNSFPALINRQMGTLVLTSSGAEFTPAQDSIAPHVQINSHNLQYKVEGKNSDFVVISSRTNPDLKITVQDLKILDILKQNHFYFGSSFRQHSPTKTRFIVATAIVALMLFSVLSMPYFISQFAGEWLVRKISFDQEYQIGQKIIEHSQNFKTPNSLSKSQKHMQVLIDYIKSNSKELADLKLHLVINQSDEVNAYAIPGSILMMNTAFIEQADSVEEIAGVIAHEIAHIYRKHTLKGAVSSVGFFALAVTFNLMLGTDVSSWLIQGTSLLSLKFTRENEKEADYFALLFLKEARISADGMLRFFEKLQKEDSVGSAADSKILSVLSSHPLSYERVKSIDEFSKQNPYSAVKLPISLDEIKKALK